MSDQDDAGGSGGRRRRSFTDAVALLDPIVPLPGRPDSLHPVTDPPPGLAAPEPLNPPAPPGAASPAAAPPVESPAHEEVPPPAASPVREPPRGKARVWLGAAALLALGAAGIGVAWVQRAQHSLPAAPLARPPPPPAPAATAAPPPASAPEPSVAAPPSPPAPLPDAAPVVATPAAPSAAPAAAPAPESDPAASASAPASTDRHVLVHFRRASATAMAVADRVAAQLQTFAGHVDTQATASLPRAPTIRYFHAEDAAAAQNLATTLRGSAGDEWHVQAKLSRRPRQPPGTFDVWLPAP